MRSRKGPHTHHQLSIPVDDMQEETVKEKNEEALQSSRPARQQRSKVAGAREDTKTRRLIERVRSQMFHRL